MSNTMMYEPKQILTYFSFGCHVTIVEMQRVLVLALARCDRGGEVADGDVESDVERSYLILMVEAGI